MMSKLFRTVHERSTAAMVVAATLVAFTVVATTASVRHHAEEPGAVYATRPAASVTSVATSAPPPSAATAATSAAAESPQPSEAAPESGQASVEPTAPMADPLPATPAPVVAQQPPASEEPPQPQAPAAPLGQPLPLEYGGGSGQVVTVVAPSWGSTTATVTAWDRNDDGSWSAAVGPVQARIGAEGIGQAREGTARTPAGTYSLTQAFGRLGDPGTSLPYFQAGPSDWWDENPDSPTYNRHVVQAESPGGDSENLYYSGSVYDYAITIDYNTGGTPGAGSAFFLHVTNGSATAGCVAIAQGSLVAILQWISPGAVIVLGVG